MIDELREEDTMKSLSTLPPIPHDLESHSSVGALSESPSVTDVVHHGHAVDTMMTASTSSGSAAKSPEINSFISSLVILLFSSFF